MRVFVAGATGKTGKHIVRQLINKNVSVTALVRNLEQARTILPDTTKLIEGDILNPVTFESSLRNVD
jgi:uncharacterized protein YbjT (DUF2867 family)